jgi:hypothetical protein
VIFLNKVVFIEDQQETFGSFSNVNSNNQRFESYRIEEIEGEKFIIGEGAAEFLETGERLSFDNFEVLTTLLNLVKGDLPKSYFSPVRYVNSLDEVISEGDVLSWVNKFGIPYIDKDINGKKYGLADRIQLDKFRFYVAKLQARFLIWKALVEEDYEVIDKYIMSLLTVKPGADLKTIKKALAQEVGAAANMSIAFAYNEKLDKNMFVLHTDSLLSVAYYQFSVWMTKPADAEGKHMKNCQRCGGYFVAKHKNKKYCEKPKCNTKNHHYHNVIKAKKE